MKSFSSQKITYYPVLLTYVRSFSLFTFIPPSGGSQNLLEVLEYIYRLKKKKKKRAYALFLDSSFLGAQARFIQHYQKPQQQGTREHLSTYRNTNKQKSSAAMLTIRTEYSMYWPMRINNQKILSKTTCSYTRLWYQTTILPDYTNYSISHKNKCTHFHKQHFALLCETQSNKTPC